MRSQREKPHARAARHTSNKRATMGQKGSKQHTSSGAATPPHRPTPPKSPLKSSMLSVKTSMVDHSSDSAHSSGANRSVRFAANLATDIEVSKRSRSRAALLPSPVRSLSCNVHCLTLTQVFLAGGLAPLQGHAGGQGEEAQVRRRRPRTSKRQQGREQPVARAQHVLERL